MKELKIFAMLIIALAAMTGCKDDDDDPAVQPATEEQMRQVGDQWYAELPMSGMTDNWRTEEEGDMTDYNEIGVIMYLNDYYTEDSYWGFIFMKDHYMVNYDGINRREVDVTFDFKMDSNGNITISSPWADIPKVSNAHFDAEKDIITADVSYKGYNINDIVFTRPTEEQQEFLNDFWETLAGAGLVGFDGGTETHHTGISGGNANEPSRAKGYSFRE